MSHIASEEPVSPCQLASGQSLPTITEGSFSTPGLVGRQRLMLLGLKEWFMAQRGVQATTNQLTCYYGKYRLAAREVLPEIALYT